MRILVWQWGRFGTGARYAFEMARALNDECGSEALLSLAEGAELLQNPTLRSAVDLPLHSYASTQEFVRRSIFIGSVLKPILAKLSANPPDAAIVTMMGYWDIFLVRRLRRMGVPVVVMVHDAEVHPGDRFHLMVRLQRELARMSEGVITLTEFVARQLAARMPLDEKVRSVIPHVAFAFADLDLPQPRLPEPAPDRPLRLLMAGRLKHYKGIQLLADALQLLVDTPLSVRVVGQAQDADEIAALAALPGVEFNLGWKSDRELIAELDWADAAVLPYVEASQSGIAPMSFKRGRPVIATPAGGLPEQVRDGETGLLADRISAPAFAAAIRRLAEDRNLMLRLAGNARRHAETELSWQALAPRFAEMLEAVARKRRGKAVSG